MKILDPTLLTQNFVFIPRIDIYNAELLYITIINNNLEIHNSNFNVVYVDGIAICTFDMQKSEGFRCELVIKNADNDVIYRGLAVYTNQNTQQYTISQGIYTYE